MKAGLPLDVGAEVRKLAEVAAGQRRDTPPDEWVDTLHCPINSDRELLELAAKAGGIDYKPDNKDWTHEDHCAFWSYDDLCNCGARWNSLDNDDNAFRLAVRLELYDFDGLLFQFFDDPLIDTSKDPYAAIRRAITRAAAEIGRNMK
jgi:hypothetical protein